MIHPSSGNQEPARREECPVCQAESGALSAAHGEMETWGLSQEWVKLETKAPKLRSFLWAYKA